jgi:hypothetical protein
VQIDGQALAQYPQLEAIIRAIHAEFDGAYGAPRMTREIKARG